MRLETLMLTLALGAVATGYRSGGGGTAEDTVSWEMTSLVAGQARHVHDAPDTGRLLSLRWLTLTAGTDGTGSFLAVEVRRSGVPLCLLAVPCTSAPAEPLPEAATPPQSCDVALAEDDHLEVVPLDDGACSVLPEGVLSASFYWE